jgi:alkaline phosphatase
MSLKLNLLWSMSTICCFIAATATGAEPVDHVREVQAQATSQNRASWGHWGTDANKFSTWFSHSNRLIPIYTFGLSLDEFRGKNSLYRDAERIKKLYGFEPTDTLNPDAEYFDQTDVYRLQKAAFAAGKRRVIVFVFDGMDWQTTQAAAIVAAGKVAYREGRGTGLNFQDYRGTDTDFGWFVTSPHNDGTQTDVSTQTIVNPGGTQRGGYAWQIAGDTPWARPSQMDYLIGKFEKVSHAYTDSASSATSLFSGIKTYNDAINVDAAGRQVLSIGRKLQEQGIAIGVVTSVPISHATPACAYANNVHRDDYQDLSRDLLGLPSVAHAEPLPGVDVLIGCGWGEHKEADKAQGSNYVPGNSYLTDADLAAIDQANNPPGKYVVAQRTPGEAGQKILQAAALQAAESNQRLFGYFGAKGGHLPFATANGDYKPTRSVPASAEGYSVADLTENPTLADFTLAALTVLETKPNGFWLLVEAGEVDWANHANNLDNSIGAVLSGDQAFATACNWIEQHGGWDDTVVIVTADHGHYFFLNEPEVLLPSEQSAAR